MTKQDIAKEYTLTSRGTVSNPGQFESEPWWVVALWDAALSGMCDVDAFDGDTEVSCFLLDPQVAAMCDEEPSTIRYVCVWVSDQGFVNHTFLDIAEIDALVPSDPEGE